MCSISQYIRWAYDVLFKEGDIVCAINVLIYLCSTHMLKSTIDKVKKIQIGNLTRLAKKTANEKQEYKRLIIKNENFFYLCIYFFYILKRHSEKVRRLFVVCFGMLQNAETNDQFEAYLD